MGLLHYTVCKTDNIFIAALHLHLHFYIHDAYTHDVVGNPGLHKPSRGACVFAGDKEAHAFVSIVWAMLEFSWRVGAVVLKHVILSVHQLFLSSLDVVALAGVHCHIQQLLAPDCLWRVGAFPALLKLYNVATFGAH